MFTPSGSCSKPHIPFLADRHEFTGNTSDDARCETSIQKSPAAAPNLQLHRSDSAPAVTASNAAGAAAIVATATTDATATDAAAADTAIIHGFAETF